MMFTKINFDSKPISGLVKNQSLQFAVTMKRDVLQLTLENTFNPRKSWNDVRANLPGRASAASVGLKVFGSSAPAQPLDLIVAPVCAPVAGTFVLWVSNTGHDPFRHKATGASSYHQYLRSRILVKLIEWCCAGWGTFIHNPPTYGFTPRHDSYIGAFGRGADVYGPYGGAGGFAAYNPRTGTYARGGAVDGPYGETSTTAARGNKSGTRTPRSRSRQHDTTSALRRGS